MNSSVLVTDAQTKVFDTDVVNYCADNEVHPKIQIIKAEQINEAWENVVNKKARYRYVIDAATF